MLDQLVQLNLEKYKEWIRAGYPWDDLAKLTIQSIIDDTIITETEDNVFGTLAPDKDPDVLATSITSYKLKRHLLKFGLMDVYEENGSILARDKYVAEKNRQSALNMETRFSNGKSVSFLGKPVGGTEGKTNYIRDKFGVPEEFEGEAPYKAMEMGYQMNQLYRLYKQLYIAGYSHEDIASTLGLDPEFVEKTLEANPEFKRTLQLGKKLLIGEMSENVIKAASPGVKRTVIFKYERTGGNTYTDKYPVQEIQEYQRGDASAMLKILAVLAPETWAEKRPEYTGEYGVMSLGSPVPLEIIEQIAMKQQNQLKKVMDEDRKNSMGTNKGE